MGSLVVLIIVAILAVIVSLLLAKKDKALGDAGIKVRWQARMIPDEALIKATFLSQAIAPPSI